MQLRAPAKNVEPGVPEEWAFPASHVIPVTSYELRTF